MIDINKVPTVRGLIETAAEKHGEKTFIKFIRDGKVEERSFKTVEEHSKAVCRWLRSNSTDKLKVALISKTTYEYITCLTGVLMSGCIAVPLAPETSLEESASLIDKTSINVLLYEEEFEQNAIKLKEICPSLILCANIGTGDFFNNIYKNYTDKSEYAALSDFEVDPDECAAIIYTSGTTGVRKGVMLSTRALVGNMMYTDYCQEIFEEDDVALSVLPMHHVYCFTGDYLKNLKDGLQVCLNGNMRDITNNLLIFEPKVIRVVPMIAQTLLRRVKAVISKNPGIDPKEAARMVFGKNIEWLISGGAYLDPALIDEYDKLGIYLRQGYGMTEAGCRISVPDEEASFESVGRVTDVCEVRIQNGEIQVNTPTVMLGYYEMPEETKKVITEDGWLRTGDIGYVTEDRQLFITGRVKNLIILSSGENVSPEAIEKKFSGQPMIDEVMVYAENDKIVAEIYPNFDYFSDNKINDIQSWLENMVDTMNLTAKAAHIISAVKVRREPFEKTSSGKIKRKVITI